MDSAASSSSALRTITNAPALFVAFRINKMMNFADLWSTPSDIPQIDIRISPLVFLHGMSVFRGQLGPRESW
jgi:hypothetical protein